MQDEFDFDNGFGSHNSGMTNALIYYIFCMPLFLACKHNTVPHVINITSQ